MIIPKIAYWQFAPNVFVGMQAGRQLMRPWEGWEGDRKTAYFRRRFRVSEGGDEE